jgi:hypothetical protein
MGALAGSTKYSKDYVACFQLFYSGDFLIHGTGLLVGFWTAPTS